MTSPISPPPVKGSGRPELPAYLSNGVIGLRVRDNPLTPGMMLLCGYSGLHPVRQIEAAACTPYPLAANISINGVWLADVPQQLTVVDQAYDFGTGELTSRLRFEAQGVKGDIEVLTFCCRHQPTLVAQEVSIRTQAPCDLKMQSLVDTASVQGRLKRRTVETPGEPASSIDGSLLWESEGQFSTCGIALFTELVGDRNAKEEDAGGGYNGPLAAQYGLRSRSGSTYRLRQIASLVPSVMHAQPDRHAERLAALGAHYGFGELQKANRAEWAELWKGRILLHGAGRRWQQLADAAFFYMNTSVHVGSPASTSMFGLATWHDYHYYYGHVMWDIETFSVPPLAFLQPEAAEALLDYRMRSLAGARSNAQSFGRKGLQFPWESAPTTGQEAAPSPGTAAWHEDHISLDVALSFVQFAQLTGDINFLRDKTWPILCGVAEWLVSRTHKSRRGYEIRRSMGIAERKTESNNEAFTMLSAQAVLRAALRTARTLEKSPGAEWEIIAENLVLPLRDGVLVSHDDYRANEEKGATPSPLMGIFPLYSDLDEDTVLKSLDYYLSRGQEYIGSPMLSSLYGVWSARRGRRVQALKMLEQGYGSFITGRFLQTLEYRADRFPEQPTAGPFFANMGGFLLSLLVGFPALKIDSGDTSLWAQREVTLPAKWQAIEVERLWVRGRPARLLATQGKRTTISFLD